MKKKAIATTLAVATMMNSTIKANACDSAAILEAATEASVACPVAAPVIVGTAVVVVTGVTIYGKCCSKSTNEELSVYYTLGHLPDYWKPGSVMDKINPGGRVIQRRLYGPDGKPKLDVDLSHHGTPKYHPWQIDGKYYHAHDHIHPKNGDSYRKRGRALTEEEYKRYVKEVNKINKYRRYRMQVEEQDNDKFVNKK